MEHNYSFSIYMAHGGTNFGTKTPLIIIIKVSGLELTLINLQKNIMQISLPMTTMQQLMKW